MEGTKSALASTGVWGGIIGFVASMAALLGYVISADDVAAIMADGEKIVAAGIGAFGSLMSIRGRLRATKKIG